MKQQTEIYGTLGPACSKEEILEAMFREGMTGIRLNLSHTSLHESEGLIRTYQRAAAKCGVMPKLLIDMQGPELRIGKLREPIRLENAAACVFVSENDRHREEQGQETEGTISIPEVSCPEIPVPVMVIEALIPGTQVLLDDGKILLEIQKEAQGKPGKEAGKEVQAEPGKEAEKEECNTGFTSGIAAKVLRGGLLLERKSIAIPGSRLTPPAMTAQDLENIRQAGNYGVTGVMQPFVRSADDLKEVREALDQTGGKDIRLFAKIENLDGVKNLESFFPLADEIVIARGDLGNAMPLWELPAVQKRIEEACRNAGKPFMVVTQMLASMEHSPVPTRAEVSDIYNAVADGAASVMVTGETAAGEYPVEVIRYLAKTAESCDSSFRQE